MSPVQNKNIVLFPFMAQGHIIPFLSLALKLENKRNCTVSFVNTPKNIKKLQNHLPQLSNIRLIEIAFDSSQYGLPPNTESTETLTYTQMIRFMESSSALKPAFRTLISNLMAEENRGTGENREASLSCIISDMFFAWSADVAHEFGILHAIFNAGGAYGMASWHTTWLNLPHLVSKSDEFHLPGFPVGHEFKAENLPPRIREAESTWKYLADTFSDWKKTDAMLLNTVEDIDRTGLNYFKEQFPNCSVLAIGPIVSPMGSKARGGEEAEETRNFCMKWLDSKEGSSVLYVSFGSQNSPSESQTIELAKALEESSVNFFWVFRPPSKTDLSDKSAKRDLFPLGYEERIRESGKGLVLKKWAPQVEILSHKSVGAFLTHCGWNSTIESLSNGVPMLSWPMGGEQAFNAVFLEEGMRVCVRVANGVDTEVKCEDMVKKIELMMKGDEGDLMRKKALKVMKMIEEATTDDDVENKGSSVRSMDDFLTMVEEKVGLARPMSNHK